MYFSVPRAPHEAMVTKNGKITFLGTSNEALMQRQQWSTRVVDLKVVFRLTVG